MKTRIAIALSFTGAFASALFACSSSSNGGTADACAAYAGAYVDYAQRCSGDVDPSRRDAIVSRYATLCRDALGLPGTGDVTSALNSCTSGLKSATCHESVNQIDGCDLDIRGTLGDGAACVSGGQCQSGDCTFTTQGPVGGDGGINTSCGTCKPALADGADCTSGGTCVTGDVCKYTFDSTTGAETGVCTKKPAPGDVGASCTSAAECKAPNHCDFTSSTVGDGTCAAPVASGGACETSNDCADGLACIRDATSATGTCGTAVAEGSACTSTDSCATGLACDPSTQKCVKIKFAAADAPCDGETILCSQGSCRETATSGDAGAAPAGVCPTIIADGQPCDDSSSSTSRCDDFASCIDGKCAYVPDATKCK